MAGRCVVLFALAGCGFDLTFRGAGAADDVPIIDADPDAQRCQQWTAQHFTPCNLDQPSPAVDLDGSHSPYTYDTTVGGGQLHDNTNALLYESMATVEQSDNSVVALMNVEAFRLRDTALLNVVGDKPLLVVAWDTIEIAGTVDVGSHGKEVDAVANIWQTTTHGAGADRECGTRAGMNGTDAVASGGSGGGGGGAFSGSGGNGAGGDDCGAPTCPRPGGPGGVATSAPLVIRGGCAGGASGKAGTGAASPANAQTIAAGGGGGGAIELAALTSISVTGRILSSGAGGAGSQHGAASGGGGGGSGGYIGLDSVRVTISGTIAANGGGGGGSGPFTNTPGRGWPGADGGITAARAAGGDGGINRGGTCGLPGAVGGSAPLEGATATGNDACGGGGGGGGAGFVMVFATTLEASTATISPAVTQ